MKNLLLLHGALGSKQQLQPIKELLSGYFKVYTLNFDGHGGPLTKNDFTIDVFTDNVLQFLKKNKLDQVAIFGYSMGGYVALNLAHKAPHRVSSIVTLGTKFAWTPEFAAKEVKMLNPNKIEEKVPAFAAMLNKIHPVNWKSVVHKTAGMMTKLGGSPNLSKEVLRAIKQPTLVCLGSLDNMVTEEESRAAADSLTNGVLRIVEGFKHQIEKNDPKVLAGIIIQNCGKLGR